MPQHRQQTRRQRLFRALSAELDRATARQLSGSVPVLSVHATLYEWVDDDGYMRRDCRYICSDDSRLMDAAVLTAEVADQADTRVLAA